MITDSPSSWGQVSCLEHGAFCLCSFWWRVRCPHLQSSESEVCSHKEPLSDSPCSPPSTRRDDLLAQSSSWFSLTFSASGSKSIISLSKRSKGDQVQFLWFLSHWHLTVNIFEDAILEMRGPRRWLLNMAESSSVLESTSSLETCVSMRLIGLSFTIFTLTAMIEAHSTYSSSEYQCQSGPGK